MMRRFHPNLVNAYDLIENGNRVAIKLPTGYEPARPISGPSIPERIRLAWAVFVGRYDALTWPGQ